MRGRIEQRREQITVACDFQRPSADLGRIVDQVVLRAPLEVEWRRLAREGLRRRQCLTRYPRLRDRALLDRPDRFACLAVERIYERLLGDLEHSLDVPAVDVDVHQDRGRGRVVIPDVVVHHLVVPSPLTGLDVQSDQRGGEEVVARVETTVVVDGRSVRRDIDEAELLIDRHRGPRRHVAGPLPGVVLPSVVSELAGTRDDVELPFQVAGRRVVRHDVARHHLLARLVVALLGGVSDDDHAVRHDRRRRCRDVADLQGNPLIGVVLLIQVLPRAPVLDQVRDQVHGPRGREPRNRHALAPVLEGLSGLRVQRVQEEAWGRDEDDPSAVDLAVGDSLAVAFAHRILITLGVRLGEAPQEFTRGRVERDHVTAFAGDRDEFPVDVGARRLRGARTEARRLKLPSDFEILEVRGVDLGGRCVARVPRVPAEVRPLPALGTRSLRHDRSRRRDQHRERHRQPERV